MIGMSYEEIVEVIVKKAGVSKEEINKKVEEKLSLLSGLISKEGAAHIIANEMRVKVFEDLMKNIKVKNGMELPTIFTRLPTMLSSIAEASTAI